MMERQFRNYFRTAAGSSGVTGETLLQLLESRLDNIVYRLGFAASRAASRQLVRHRHITVNERMVDIPSYQLRPNDVVAVRERSRNLVPIVAAIEGIGRRGELPDWLEVNEKIFAGRMTRVPSREAIAAPVQENLIVELYSK
jgi:small subunit ribosomal protein S4